MTTAIQPFINLHHLEGTHEPLWSDLAKDELQKYVAAVVAQSEAITRRCALPSVSDYTVKMAIKEVAASWQTPVPLEKVLWLTPADQLHDQADFRNSTNYRVRMTQFYLSSFIFFVQDDKVFVLKDRYGVFATMTTDSEGYASLASVKALLDEFSAKNGPLTHTGSGWT